MCHGLHLLARPRCAAAARYAVRVPPWARVFPVQHACKKPGERAPSIDFAVARGETVAVLGPNGAGKSTLMRMLSTLLPPTSGTAEVAGFDVTTQSALVGERIRYVGQGNGAGHTHRVRGRRLVGGISELLASTSPCFDLSPEAVWTNRPGASTISQTKLWQRIRRTQHHPALRQITAQAGEVGRLRRGTGGGISQARHAHPFRSWRMIGEPATVISAQTTSARPPIQDPTIKPTPRRSSPRPSDRPGTWAGRTEPTELSVSQYSYRKARKNLMVP